MAFFEMSITGRSQTMPIVYQEESKQFYLHTEHTSYVMELYENHLIPMWRVVPEQRRANS